MRRKGKPPKFRQTDPTRTARIQAMRQGERQLHATLEHALKMGRELGDRMHYDRLCKEISARLQDQLKEITDLVEHERWRVFERCILADHALRRECETLRDQLDKVEGRPARPDVLTIAEPMLAQLPPEQAAALSFVLVNASQPAPPAPETTEAFDECRVFVERLTARTEAVRRETTTLFEIAAEKVRRGWMAQSEIDSRQPATEKFLAQIEAAVPAARKFLASSLADYESLLQRRQELREALAKSHPHE